MNSSLSNPVLDGIRKEYGLDSLKVPIHLNAHARSWGVTSVETGKINAEAMLLSDSAGSGYKIILKDYGRKTLSSRQRFSFAHELAHLLLRKSGLSMASGSASKHRHTDSSNPEERLCDQIAAEVLMPRADFKNAGSSEGWTLKSLGRLAAKYETSMEATAIRMVDLMPEPSILGVWRYSRDETPTLRWKHSQPPRYRLPQRIAKGRQWLLSRALKSRKVEDGVAPVFAARTSRYPVDAVAEALAVGSGEHCQVMAFYYPEREVSQEMAELGKLAKNL